MMWNVGLCVLLFTLDTAAHMTQSEVWRKSETKSRKERFIWTRFYHFIRFLAFVTGHKCILQDIYVSLHICFPLTYRYETEDICFILFKIDESLKFWVWIASRCKKWNRFKMIWNTNMLPSWNWDEVVVFLKSNKQYHRPSGI